MNNKSAFINDIILENQVDCAALTETWLSSDDDLNKVVLSSAVPDGYDILHVPRETRGGGVGFVYKKHLRVKMDNSLQFSSFECMTVLLESSSFTFRFIIVYRVPPSSTNNIQKSSFISDFGDLLECTSNLSGKLVIVGDFNVHMDSVDDREQIQLTSLLNSFGMEQHVSGATHSEGHTLDLVITRQSDNIVNRCEVGGFVSDHNTILCSLRSGNHHAVCKNITFRKIKTIDTAKFSEDLQNSVSQHSTSQDVDVLVSSYNSTLSHLLDQHAPLKTSSLPVRDTQPWINDAVLEAKR